MSERIIYSASPLEILTNERFKLQQLEDEGHNMRPLLEDNWNKIVEVIESGDAKKLGHLREILSEQYGD